MTDSNAQDVEEEEQISSSPPLSQVGLEFDSIENHDEKPAEDDEEDVNSSETAVEQGQTYSQASTPQKIRRRRSADTALPPLRLTVRNQLVALTIFAELSNSGTQPVMTRDVAYRIEKSEATLQSFIKFFTLTGFIVQPEGGTGFLPSAELRNYNNLKGHDEDGANEQLKPLIEKSWFGRAIASEIKINPNPTHPKLITALALTANVNLREKDYNAQLQQLVEWAEVTKLIYKDSTTGAYRLNVANGQHTSNQHASTPPARTTEDPLKLQAPKISGFDAIVQAIENQPLTLEQVRQLTPQELADLGAAINTFKVFAKKFGGNADVT